MSDERPEWCGMCKGYHIGGESHLAKSASELASVSGYTVSVQLTPDEVIDLRMLSNSLQHSARWWLYADERRDADRHLRVVDKILRAV